MRDGRRGKGAWLIAAAALSRLPIRPSARPAAMSDPPHPPVHIEDEEMEAKYDGSDTAMAPQGQNHSDEQETKQPAQQTQTQQAPSPSPTSASAPPLSTAPASPASSVHLAVRVLSLRSSYTAKQNHFLACDPLLVVAVDHRPLFKTSQTHTPHTHTRVAVHCRRPGASNSGGAIPGLSQNDWRQMQSRLSLSSQRY